MSVSSVVVAPARPTVAARLLDYAELTKLKIAVLELVVVLAAAVVASWGQPQPLPLMHAMLGTLLVAASASAANQWLERQRDARMPRTSSRPLPAGRLASSEVLALSLTALVAGGLELAVFVNAASSAWALLTWAIYVLAYTPLKTISVLNTAVGAVAGALPVFIGWSAASAQLDQRALALFMLLFLWQFPHFMAIAWLYRRDYALGGYQMLTVVDPSGARAGRQAVLAALLLLPVSVAPVIAWPGVGAIVYVACALLLGVGQLLCAAWFWRQPGDGPARLLLRASLIYLPTLLVMLMLAPWI
jgi:protoheme IX farnesyltransferase